MIFDLFWYSTIQLTFKYSLRHAVTADKSCDACFCQLKGRVGSLCNECRRCAEWVRQRLHYCTITTSCIKHQSLIQASVENPSRNASFISYSRWLSLVKVRPVQPKDMSLCQHMFCKLWGEITLVNRILFLPKIAFRSIFGSQRLIISITFESNSICTVYKETVTDDIRHFICEKFRGKRQGLSNKLDVNTENVLGSVRHFDNDLELVKKRVQNTLRWAQKSSAEHMVQIYQISEYLFRHFTHFP